jgi:hypothetical protein
MEFVERLQIGCH